ncbi:MAG: allantoinase AllB [Gemmatimonadetes bacterium]|nr:allantoinase AllB [Gemmatimonadota bacterium]NNM03706.1 allantoinase AllB [Gemmatimonadota bacterium]
MKRRLINARIPTGGNGTAFREILVVDGKIAEVVGPGDGAGGEDTEVVDLQGHLLLPGIIDGHVHFDDPGFTHRENFETGTRAAAAGGVTCVVDMPCTSLPPVIGVSSLQSKLDEIRPKAHVDFMLWGGMSANVLVGDGWSKDLEDLVEAGVASIKVYMLSGMDTFKDLSKDQLRSVLTEARRLGIPVGVHAEDRKMVRALEAGLRGMGRNDPLAYAASRPEAAEVSAVQTMVGLCEITGTRVHIVHVACRRAMEVIAEARAEGLPVSGETCPHFLAFTVDDLEEQGSLLKTAPVVKAEGDRTGLWEGLAAGSLEFVATDHAAGQWPEEKETGSIWTDYGGVPGVETSLPYLYSEGVRTGRLTLERLVEVTASAPARFFGIDNRKGRIAVGLDADFAVLDETERWTVRAADLHNLNRYTPLEGRELMGRVRATILRGETAYSRAASGTETFGPTGAGEWVMREKRAEL